MVYMTTYHVLLKMTSDRGLFEFLEALAESDDLIGLFAMPGMANIVVGRKWVRIDSTNDTYSADRRIDSLAQKSTFYVI
jgi:hypothetical protein